MPARGITHLIVNSPYDEPKHHWHYHRETRVITPKAWLRDLRIEDDRRIESLKILELP